jgi:hypothetical protein
MTPGRLTRLCTQIDGRKKPVIKISETEEQRLADILSAAKTGDWDRFACLTDCPFSNTEAMKEQFEDSSRLIRDMNNRLHTNTETKNVKDGSRIIFTRIATDMPAENPILLTLHSTSKHADSVISIWTFFQEVGFD